MNVFLKLTISLFVVFTFSLTSGLPAVRKSRPNVRVFGGDDASPGQFPFIVSHDVDFGHYCGGSIINENWVVTAAHCLVDYAPADYTVLAGTTLLDSGGTVFNISKIIVHSDFNYSMGTDDIALIKIDGGFTFDSSVQTIKIGQVSGSDPVTVIGWGETEEGLPNVLQYANLTALSDEDCTKKSEGGLFIRPRGPGQVCALASKGIAPCYRDSGGPLIFNITLVGLMSYAVWPCANGYPDVYTRTSYYVEWINNIIKNN